MSDDDIEWMDDETQPLQDIIKTLYGDDESSDEGQEWLPDCEIDSDEYDESEEAIVPPYSPLSSPECSEDEPDSPIYLQLERSRSRSPLGQHPNPRQEFSDDVIIFKVTEHDGTPLDEYKVDFLDPNVHVSLAQTTAMSGRAPDLGRVRARDRGLRRGRGRGQGVGRCHQVCDQGAQWSVGHPLQEIWLSDHDVPSELRQMARDVLRRRLNERRNEEEPEEVAGGTDIPLQGEDLNFEWSPMETFRGEEEIFRPARTGAVESYTSAYDAFRSYWDDSILRIIADETNRYATEIDSIRFQDRWYPTNADEMLCLFAFWQALGIIRMPTIVSCFTKNPLLKTTVFRHIFSRDRYDLLSLALRFVDEKADVETVDPTISDLGASSDRIYHLRPIVDHLNAKFQANYIPSQNICIDESLTLWKGKLDIKQYIRLKASKFGIKTFELCESATGYLFSFIVYTGKQTSVEINQAPNELSSFAIVKRLMGPLLNKGYKLFMDNWYNSPLLARFLKRNGTDCVGTLRPTRKDVPYLIANAPLMRGQLVARHAGDVCVLAWEDKKRVTMISTCHGSATGLPRIHTNSKRPIAFKPQVVLDYNRSMGGVDLKDQMLEPYLIERKRGKLWFIKMFKRLLNISILNARILLESSQNSRVDHLGFRLELLDAILSRHLAQVPVLRLHSAPKPRVVVTHRHWPVCIPNPAENERRNNRQARARCFLCSSQGIRNRTTPFMCEGCQVPLCAVNCFKAYHT
ncbi:piggyBac transposable element-derived protein 4 [Manduca sexta]|uniref:piggyBac transposable element-derived protein 4 n=1 Tax=Manduca sexta TaxID=7130 RepID=UPI001182C87A|nr:piggyBac transposable element-derived protein 4 [Manduca sexta]KAG6438653.1 hypothetical protein O3G_MSEX000118 [Manduca sexta]